MNLTLVPIQSVVKTGRSGRASISKKLITVWSNEAYAKAGVRQCKTQIRDIEIPEPTSNLMMREARTGEGCYMLVFGKPPAGDKTPTWPSRHV